MEDGTSSPVTRVAMSGERDGETAPRARTRDDNATTPANVGEHAAVRLAETDVRHAQIWLVPPVRSAQVRSG
jgi:hypothetical protein